MKRVLTPLIAISFVACTPKVVVKDDGTPSTLKPLPVSLVVKGNGAPPELERGLEGRARKTLTSLGHAFEESGAPLEIDYRGAQVKGADWCVKLAGRVVRGERFAAQADAEVTRCMPHGQELPFKGTQSELDLLLAPIIIAAALAMDVDAPQGVSRVYAEAVDELVRALSRRAQTE